MVMKSMLTGTEQPNECGMVEAFQEEREDFLLRWLALECACVDATSGFPYEPW